MIEFGPRSIDIERSSIISSLWDLGDYWGGKNKEEINHENTL